MATEMLVRDLLCRLGEDPNREGLIRTPYRVAKSLADLTSGYSLDLQEITRNGIFAAEGGGTVLQKDIEFYSLCEHHLLPFHGTIDVTYRPSNKIIGLSKICRIVDMYAKRLQVQERLTAQIADALMNVLDPLGVCVEVTGSHFCMMMRGVRKQNSTTITKVVRGELGF